jgi:hypothetical protein
MNLSTQSLLNILLDALYHIQSGISLIDELPTPYQYISLTELMDYLETHHPQSGILQLCYKFYPYVDAGFLEGSITDMINQVNQLKSQNNQG